MFVTPRLLVSISRWMTTLAQTKHLSQILKRAQVKRKIEEFQISLMNHISILQVGVTDRGWVKPC
jgi:hypothetical protein